MSEAPKLLDRVRAEVRARHYSRRTEEAYTLWIRRYILFHNKRHPSSMGGDEVNAFLTKLAVEDNVSASTQARAPKGLSTKRRCRKGYGTRSGGRGSRSGRRVTHFATLSRRTCWSAARTSGQCRNCSATGMWPPR